MSSVISPVQTIEELEFVKKNNPSVDILPLDLSTFLICKQKRISFVNPIHFSDNKLHVEIIEKTDLILSKIILKNNCTAFEKEFTAICRFYLHQIYFIKFILKRILNNYPKIQLYVSGFENQTNTLLSDKNYYTSKIVNRLFPDFTIKAQNQSTVLPDHPINSFKIKDHPKIDILLYSTGYNFHRLNQVANKLGIRVGKIHYESLTLKDRYLNFSRDTLPVEIISYSKDIETFDYIKYLDNLDGVEGNLLKEHINKVKHLLYKEYKRCLIVKEAVEKTKPRITASFAMRGSMGAILDIDNNNINSICIPHGTVTACRLNQDKSYRKTIAEAVFTGKTKWLALQSNISKEAYKDLQPSGQAFIGGNLIFNESCKSFINKKKIILYAVTLKNFFGMQFYGVETYYEFCSNLMKLEQIQSEIDYPIVVKLHPAARDLKKLLKDEFKKLIFATSDLNNLLSKSLATISHSSSVVEDSLYSEVPVILFDPWNRYQHCFSESKTSKENKAIYYITEVKDLKTVIQTIKTSKSIDYEEYIIPGKSKENIKQLFEKLM